MRLLIVKPLETGLPESLAKFQFVTLSVTDAPQQFLRQVDLINQITPLYGIVFYGATTLPHSLLARLRWRLQMPIEVINADAQVLTTTVQQIAAYWTKHQVAAVEHYRDPQTWHNQGIDNNPYYRHELQIVSRQLAGKSFRHLLDLGAGYGRLSRAVGGNAQQVTLFDGSAAMLAVAERLGGRGKMVVGNIDQAWPFADGSFDLIVGLQIINHSADLQHFFAELRRVLAPDGIAYLSVGNRLSLRHLLSFRQAHFPTAGFRRLSAAVIENTAGAAQLTCNRIGAAGLGSPYHPLQSLEFFERFSCLQSLSHLLIFSLRKASN